MNYYYHITFGLDGLEWVKFGSGTNGRQAQVERSIAAVGGQVIASGRVDTGDFGHRALEAHTHKQHALTRYWGFRGMFDGCTEVWPASETSALLRTAARTLAAMKTGAQFAEPSASESVVDLFRSIILAMPNHKQLNILDLCSGDGALSDNLIKEVNRVVQVTIDPPATLPGDVPNFDVQVVPGDVLAIPDGRRADVVVINPPFSNRKETGSQHTTAYYWKFIRKAQTLAPVVIFIAPGSWEQRLGTRDRTGIYEVVAHHVDFDGHPTASVVKWTAGPEFKVIGGKDDRKPEVPQFDVEVLPTRSGAENTRVPAPSPTIGLEFTRVAAGTLLSNRAPMLVGPDAEAFIEWLIDNKEAIINWWGRVASGQGQITTSAIRELLA